MPGESNRRPRAVAILPRRNLLYRKSVEGKQPEWIARWLDLWQAGGIDRSCNARPPSSTKCRASSGRPAHHRARPSARLPELEFRPGRHRTDGVAAEDVFVIGHRSVISFRRGGGHDAWISRASSAMRSGSILSCPKRRQHIARDGMACAGISARRFTIRDSRFTDFVEGDAVYRFFELFDTANRRECKTDLRTRHLENHPPDTSDKTPFLRRRCCSALLWNRNLQSFWRQELGDSSSIAETITPYSWLVDPSPLPPHAAIPSSI